MAVWDEAWGQFCLFTTAPWRLGGKDQPVGLNWSDTEVIARGLGVEWSADTIHDLIAMESAALAVWRKGADGGG